MPCVLTPSTTSKEDFTAPVKADVTLKLKAPSGAGGSLVHIRYDHDEIDSTPPLQFTVKGGPKMLVVLVEASKPGALLSLSEVCAGDGEHVIDRFHYDPKNPARGYIIRGLSS